MCQIQHMYLIEKLWNMLYDLTSAILIMYLYLILYVNSLIFVWEMQRRSIYANKNLTVQTLLVVSRDMSPLLDNSWVLYFR